MPQEKKGSFVPLRVAHGSCTRGRWRRTRRQRISTAPSRTWGQGACVTPSTSDASREKSHSVDLPAYTLVTQGSPINDSRLSAILTWVGAARRPGVASARAPCEEMPFQNTPGRPRDEVRRCPIIPFLVSLQKNRLYLFARTWSK